MGIVLVFADLLTRLGNPENSPADELGIQTDPGVPLLIDPEHVVRVHVKTLRNPQNGLVFPCADDKRPARLLDAIFNPLV